jgi:glycosyltransferase involved in cell wall biosynthesis
MNVLILATSFFPSIGGLEQVAKNTALKLRRQGFHAVVVTERRPYTLKHREIIDGIPVYRLFFPSVGQSIQGSLFAAAMQPYNTALLSRLIKDYAIDIIHLQGVGRNATYGVQAAQANSVPLIATVQGIEVEGVLSKQLPAALERWQRRQLEQTVTAAHAVSSCSTYLGERLLEVVPSARVKLLTIYNGIDAQEFAQQQPRQQLPNDYILGIGRFVAKKGFDVLLRAYAVLCERLTDVPALVLAGDGVERAHLHQLAQALNIAERIIWLGPVTDRTQIAALYQHAHLCVIPSRHEPLGIVTLEAMAAGCPLVASRVGGIPEVVRDGIDGVLVKADDSEALADAMQGVLTGRNRLAPKQVRQQRAVSFDWNTIIDQYQQLYRDVQGKIQ